MTARFRVASVVAVIIFTIALMGVGGIPGAVATQDQPVNAGQLNTETKETVVQNITATVSGCAAVPANGLLGCGTWGVEGLGTARGVFGMGSTSGVYGKSDSGTGVEGKTGGENANGVYGNADNSGGSGSTARTTEPATARPVGRSTEPASSAMASQAFPRRGRSPGCRGRAPDRATASMGPRTTRAVAPSTVSITGWGTESPAVPTSARASLPQARRESRSR